MNTFLSSVVTTLIVPFVFSPYKTVAQIGEIVSNNACRPGTILVNDIEVSYCIYIGTAVTWSAARDVCLRNDAVLYNQNSDYRTRQGRSLTEYLMSNGINQTWAGLFVKDGKLITDVLDPPGVQSGQGPYVWSTGEPVGDEKCTSATLGLGGLVDEVPPGSNIPDLGSGSAVDTTSVTGSEIPSSNPNGPGARKKRAVTGDGTRLSLTDCGLKLPFLCVANALPFLNLGSVPICKNGTLGSYKLNRCYNLSEDRATYDEVENQCRKQGGQLARAYPDYYSNVIRQALVIFQRRQANPVDKPSPGPMVWVDASRRCNVIDNAMSEGRHHWNCDAKLRYVCEMPTESDDDKDETEVEVRVTKATSVTPLGTSGDHEVFIRLDDIYQEETKSASLICKVKGYDPLLHKVAWYRNGEVIQHWLYKTIGDEVYLNLTQRLLSRQPPAYIVGYYWCEVKALDRLQQSDRYFVRFVEMELHAGSIETNETSRVPPSKYSLFNLMGFNPTEIRAAVGSYQVTEISPFPVFIRALRFRNNGSYMDFQVYRERSFSRSAGFSPEVLLQNARDELMVGFKVEEAVKYFISDTLKVRSIDYCFAYTHVYKMTGQKFNIGQTEVGATFFTPAVCGVDKQPMGRIKCKGNKMYGAYWGEFQFNGACDYSDISETGISNTLKNLSEIEVNMDNIEDVLDSATGITKNATLSELDLLYTATILENAANVSNMTTKAAEEIYNLYNKILETSEEVLQESQQRGRVANRVLNSMDVVAEKVVQQPSGYQRFVTNSFGTEVWDLTNPTVSELVIGLQFTETGYQPVLNNENMVSIFERTDVKYAETVAAIIFPKDFVQQLVSDAKGKTIRLSMHIFKNTRLFTVSENSTDTPAELVLNSVVIAAKILIDGEEITDIKGAEVTTVFMPKTVIPDDLRRNLSACGYWNFTGNNDTGGWSTDGCRYQRKEGGRDVCVCDHLTNFAVLLDFYGQSTLPPEHALPLSIITIIGLGLSIIGLSLTVLSFVTFKKLRQTRPQQTLFNLALAELCSWVIFLAGVNQTQDHVGCIVVAALLHYFIVASFMWMFMEALLHYLMFVKVLGTYFNRYMLKTTIPAWGVPILPVIIVLAIDTNLYRGGDSYCWMSLTPFYYAFALPVGLIILSNIVIYIMVVVSICRRSKVSSQNSQTDRERALVNIRAAFFCFVLLGLSWTFGYLTLSGARIAFQYVFTITTTIQGFLIFILFTARDKKVRDSWRALCCKEKKEVPSSGRVTSDNLPLNKSNSNDSAGSNRTNTTGISSVPYYSGYEHQFQDFRNVT